MFPTHRPRRLRRSEQIRDLVRETCLHVQDFIYPLFVQEVGTEPQPIDSMPGQMRHTVDSLLDECERAVEAGVRAVLLFGIPERKDDVGTEAYAESGIVQRALQELKKRGFPLVLMTDVCMCEYTSHGHCGIVEGGHVDNDKTLELLARTAVSHAQAGADLVAPSDMMDGRVRAIRRALDEAGFDHVAIMSYAAKYASAYYGPFREAADSAPRFGDRRGYQMDPANAREALREVEADVEEGADIVMVKPALAYLDIIREVRQRVNLPVAAYNVSGEYSMIEAAAKAGMIDRRRVILETLLSIKRAGADLILTYWAREAAGWLRCES
ncbi:MAG: porphobilinogen synthase [Deltaproteobacteria bacterium]|nr:MAG: porphobilinogen synthase [Deltaproteobacteria bacterium]